MRRPYVYLTVVTVVIVVLGTDWFFRAESVEHHGVNAGMDQECVSCHNAYVTPTNFKCMPICLFGKSHPLRKSYPPPNRENAFNPVAYAQSRGIVFLEGKMDCISCHSLNIKSRYHLRISNWNAEMCEACHRK